MKRYIKVYLSLIRFNLSLLLTYRLNLISNILSSLGWAAVGVINMFIITSKVSQAYGWSRNELILLAAVYPIFSGIFYLLVAGNIGEIPDIVNRGELDARLLKPIDSQFLLSTFSIDFIQLARIVCSGIFMVVFIWISHMVIPWYAWFFGAIFMSFGILIVYSIWYSVITLSVWFTTLSNLKEFLYIFNGALRYPADVFIQKRNILLTPFILFTFSLSVPLKVFFGKIQWYEILLLLFFSIGSFLFTRWFWKFALRFYVSASN